MDLSINEKMVLKAIGDIEMTSREVAEAAGLKVEAAVHAAYVLEENGLAAVREDVITEYVLTDEGRKYAEQGLPERTIYKALPEQGETLTDLKKTFPPSTINIAMGWLRQKGWAKFDKRDGETIHYPAKSRKVGGRAGAGDLIRG